LKASTRTNKTQVGLEFGGLLGDFCGYKPLVPPVQRATSMAAQKSLRRRFPLRRWPGPAYVWGKQRLMVTMVILQ